jgi:hypothetical protein
MKNETMRVIITKEKIKCRAKWGRTKKWRWSSETGKGNRKKK